jgi:hypothetical protein
MVSMQHAITLSYISDVLDPRYEDEVSGCTATVAIISAKRIFVVRDGAYPMPTYTLIKT